MFQITVNTRRAIVGEKELITTRSAGIQVQFTFSEDWDGLAKFAIFRNGEDDESRVAMAIPSSGLVELPAENCAVDYIDEPIFAGVYGNNGLGTTIIPTIWASMGVLREGASYEGAMPADPTPDMWAQILAIANEAHDIAEDCAEAEQLRAAAEELRVAAETARAAAENGRVSAEEERVTAENLRATAEDLRVTAENARSAAEQDRATAEAARASAEASRQQNESTRQSNETARQTAESNRASAESTRASNEQARRQAETARADAEDARADAETARVLAESARVAAEQARVNAENARGTAEDARASAEALRASAESARASAEAARATAESNRADTFADWTTTFNGWQSTLDGKADQSDLDALSTDVTELNRHLSDVSISANAFSASKAETGKAINSSGEIVSLGVGFVTDYIPVFPGCKLITNMTLGSSYYYHAIYDASKVRIELRKSNNDNLTMTMPANAAFIRLTGNNNLISSSYVYIESAVILNDIATKSQYLEAVSNSLLSANLLTNNTESGKANEVRPAGEPVFVSDINVCCCNRIDVVPNAMYYIKLGFQTSRYGHTFYDADYKTITSYTASGDNKILIAPPNAKQLIVTSVLSTLNEQMVCEVQNMPIEQMAYLTSQVHNNTLYARTTLKEPKFPADGFNHEAFPSMCFWNNNLVAVTRLGTQHTTPTDPSNWGGIHFRLCDETGTWSEGAMFTKSDFTNLDGEIRDAQIQPTRDGEHLILATWTTYKIDNVDKHDNLLVVLDKNLTVENYLVTKATDAIYWGNPLITPDGHLIVAGYLNNTVTLWRSDEVFDGDVSTLTMTKAVTLISESTATEACIGYTDDKLYCLVRIETTSAKMIWTSNLEGTDGWGTPKEIGIVLHAPKLLPYASGKYIPFAGALYKSNALRKPVIGFIDTDTNEVASYGVVDDSVVGFSSYCGFVPFGKTDFGIIYYQEMVSGVPGTALYYKRYNARYNQGAVAYFL